MIKRFIQFLFAMIVCTNVFAVDMYNAIATAYVTTTISQNVVFDSTMQQGGTFTMSVLAHNGGGRAGQSDTANVKIEFYTSAGTLVTSANSTYSANLPNPNAVCGNPCIDPAVPWTTLTISKTLTAAQAATVAYAKISMYGIDGSYWAGDYGPWYRAPTFTLDGGVNRVYNPEFGPYNNITAQGWTSSPGFGACQGAWGGSNACIVNSSGVPGTSTTGLVANQNGGGPSATGGTTSGTPGGYNSTMTTTNATGAPVVTLVSTVVTYNTRTATSGNTTTTYRTPVTTQTYSDGSTVVTNGTEATYSTAVTSNVVTNKIVNGVMTVYTTPITTTTLASDNSKTVTSNGPVTETTQNVQTGLNFNVWRYDYHTYTCGWLGCIQNFGAWTWQNPSMNASNYGTPVNSGVTTGGIFVPTNSDMPNNDSGWGYADGTVINYTGTITAPITQAHPAGSVYRLYFYNQSDDGFVLTINGQTVIFNNANWQLQGVLGVYNDNGWIDVVAGQTYNLDAWYWNTEGGWGLRLYWDFGSGKQLIPNDAFTTGWITEVNTVDATGISYSNPNVVNVSGTMVAVGPTVEGGTITMTNSTGTETITSGTSSTAGLDNNQQTRVDAWQNKTLNTGNSINLDVNGSNNTLYIEQVGSKNLVTGIGQSAAVIQGSSNNITVKQGTTGAGQNEIDLRVIGNTNTLNIGQARDNLGVETGTNGHYQAVDINGYQNVLTTQQSNSTLGGHYQETTINGNQNNVTKRQTDNGNKIMFTTITGDNNTVDAVQRGTGQHQLTTNLTGNNNSALIVQEGTQQNKANIDLTNAGGPATLDLQQSGGKNFTIIQSCTNPAGCSTVVRQ